MFGLDDAIANLSSGASVVVVLFVAALLGLRHATDPDHLAAVTTLVASGEEKASRAAARLGAFWGLDHAPPRTGGVRASDRACSSSPAGARATGRRDGRRCADRVPRDPVARPLAPRLLQPARPYPRGRAPRALRPDTRRAFGIGLVHGTGGSAGVGL